MNELAEQLTWSETSARLFHFRDRDGMEVDIIVEAADGRLPFGDRLAALPAADVWS